MTSSPLRLITLTALAMAAFAGNSLLCRLALTDTDIDAASFTTLRMVSGAVVLGFLVLGNSRGLAQGFKPLLGGSWVSAAALLAYAAGFSFAYITLTAATGALLLFGAVQATMISYGLYLGERPNVWQTTGMAIALVGLLVLFLPGLEAPPLKGAILMLVAGFAWGVYSVRGRRAVGATRETAGNFLRAVPMAAIISLFMLPKMNIDLSGAVYAVGSGALASGLGYAVWYTVLADLKTTTAATVQLSVPVLTAFGGVVFLSEPITWKLVWASMAVLGGVGLYIMGKERSK